MGAGTGGRRMCACRHRVQMYGMSGLFGRSFRVIIFSMSGRRMVKRSLQVLKKGCALGHGQHNKGSR